MIEFLNILEFEEEKTKFEQLYNKYSNLLYYIAMQKLNNPEDAEECVQDAFFYIARNFNKIGDVDSKTTRNYLSTIISGFAINKFNKLKKIEFISNNDDNIDIEEMLYSANSPELFEDYDSVELSMLIDELPEDTRIYLYLTYHFGYNSKEIAEMYNISDSLVRKKLQFAKIKLKKKLGKD